MMDFIDSKKQNNDYTAFQSITYSEIRNEASSNEKYKLKSRIFPYLWSEIGTVERDILTAIETARSDVNAQRFDWLKCILGLVVFNAVMFVIAHLFVLSKLFQILFPYVIIAYLSNEYVQNGMQWWIEIDMFQRCMLFIYIGLQCVLLILGVCVCKLHWYLWH